MKKIYILAVIVITAFCFLYLYDKNKESNDLSENRGIFVSYIEFFKYLNNKSEEDTKKEIDIMIDNIKKYHFNTIYLQVRPFSDSIYYSNIFPTSHTIVLKQGDKLPFDILEYFITQAKKNKIKLHAWINPYRISNDVDTSKVVSTNPAYKWLNTNNVMVIKDKGIYYNPSSEEVISLIIKGIEEIVLNYDIDGILLDDYFYPNDTIDLENYKQEHKNISLKEYRFEKVNKLIRGIYSKIKEINSNVEFGISPDGNLDNNYNTHYADIKTWVSQNKYIDYIMPQLYYGFSNEVKPFIETLNEWNNLIKNDTKLIVALALYKAGTVDNYAKSGKNEWINNNNVIRKQIQVSRNVSNYSGYSFFRYDYLVGNIDNINLQQEIKEYEFLFQK